MTTPTAIDKDIDHKTNDSANNALLFLRVPRSTFRCFSALSFFLSFSLTLSHSAHLWRLLSFLFFCHDDDDDDDDARV